MKNIKFLSILGLASLAMFVSCTEDDGVERPWEPDITDLSVGTVSYDSAMLSARFSDDLKTAPAEVGVMYSTDFEVDAEPTNVLGTVNADNKQVYDMQLSELEANSTYYYYIYSLKTEASTDTIKSAISSFETLALQTAKVESPKLVEATDTSMEVSFVLNDNGGEVITEYGVYVFEAGEKTAVKWYKSEEEVTSFPYTMTFMIDDLHYSTEYDLQTYAKSAVGNVYGPRLSYKTLDPRVYSPTYDLIGRNLSLAADIREDVTGATASGFLVSPIQGLPQDDAQAIHVNGVFDGQAFTSEADTKIEVNTDYWVCAYIETAEGTIYGDTTKVDKIEVKPFIVLNARNEDDYTIRVKLQGKVDPATMEGAKDNFVLDVVNTYNGANYVGTATIASITVDEEDREIIYFTTNEKIYNTDVVTLSHVVDETDLVNDLEMPFDDALFEPIVVKSHLDEPMDNPAFVLDGTPFGWNNSAGLANRVLEVADPTDETQLCFQVMHDRNSSKMIGNLDSPFSMVGGRTYHLTFKILFEEGGKDKYATWFAYMIGDANAGAPFSSKLWIKGGNPSGMYNTPMTWHEMSFDITLSADVLSAFYYLNTNGAIGNIYYKDFYMSDAEARTDS